MTTAEFIIGHSADDAADRRKEGRKIIWALLAAILIHLVIGYLLAISSGLFSAALPVVEEDKPLEMTFVDLSTPVPIAPKNSMFVTNDESKQAPTPAEKTFESNANSVGASELPATGNMPVPSQDGRDQPYMSLQSQQHSLQIDGAQPQPSAPPMPSVQPSPAATAAPSQAPTVAPTPQKDALAMLTKTPAPKPVERSTPVQPQRPKSAYRPEQVQTRMRGNISNRGQSSVNAVGTPLGRYQKQLIDAIGSRWYYYMDQQRDLATIGTLRLRFFVDPSGKVKNLRITENSSNESFANICLQSVLDVKMDPIPPDVASALPPEGLEVEDLGFSIFSN